MSKAVPAAGPNGSGYTPELAERICQLIMENHTLSQIEEMDGMPASSTIRSWLIKHPEFYEDYFKARMVQVEGLADEIVEIADDGRNDFMEVANARGEVKVVTDHENINRSKLRIDTRMRLLGKLFASKYGERVDVNHSGGVSAQLIIKGRNADGDAEAG